MRSKEGVPRLSDWVLDPEIQSSTDFRSGCDYGRNVGSKGKWGEIMERWILLD